MKKNFARILVFMMFFALCTQQIHAQNNAGDMASDFTAKALDGKDITLSKFKGKYVLIDFWGSWCGPCRKASPLMVELYKQTKEKKLNIEFVSIAINERNDDIWKKAIQDDKLTWVQINNSHLPQKNNIAAQYQIRGVPTCILISPEGRILYRAHPVTLIPKIKEMFAIE
jgi:thiol-disulfide isomerase/thioredoxin